MFFDVFLVNLLCILELLFALHLVYVREMEKVTQTTYESWDEHWQIIK